MTESDILIAYLVDALDAVRRADSLAFAQGVADQAMLRANRERIRNRDGYLVMPQDAR